MEARQQRYKISVDFGNNTKFDINFIAKDFNLVMRSQIIWAAKIDVFCNKYAIKHNWLDQSLWAILTFLNIQNWNEDVTIYRNSPYERYGSFMSIQ